MLRQIVGISVLPIRYVNKSVQTGKSLKIELKPGKEWKEIRFSGGTAKLSEKPKSEGQGVSYSQKLQCNIKGDQLPKSVMDVLENVDLLVRIEYNTKEYEIWGCPSFPVRFTAEYEVVNSSLYKLEFTCNTIYRTFSLLE